MEDYLQEMIGIVNKNFHTNIPSNLVRVPLFKHFSRNEFENFLVQSRIIPLLQMKIIFQFGMRSACAMGYEKYCHYTIVSEGDEITEPEYKIKEYGTAVETRKYSAKEIFDYLLYKLGISTVDVKLSDFNTEYVNAKGTIPSLTPDCSSQAYDRGENPAIILLDLPCIITEDTLLISKQYFEETQKLLDYHRQIFEDFLNAHKNSVTIPHDIYIEWLLKWFPGMIHIRSLPQK